MKPKITIRKCDVRREVFRAGGPGGQHQNKTESAVRYIHLPTGVRAESRSERSQHQNDGAAWALLIAKLCRRVALSAAEARRARHACKPPAAFGYADRTYVLDGDHRVVDHRTGFRSQDPIAVLRGRLDGFLRASLAGEAV